MLSLVTTVVKHAAARWYRPPVAVNLIPFHTQDFAAALRCDKAEFQAAGHDRLAFVMGLFASFTSLSRAFQTVLISSSVKTRSRRRSFAGTVTE
jgi:hypothetical protein